MKICRCSSLYETEPVEVIRQPDFINMSCEIRTAATAEELLDMCLLVERGMGRLRNRSKGPRTIDIDILYFGSRVSYSERLSLPHPAIPRRRFVLVPMVEIAPDFQDPASGLTMQAMLDCCPDISEVRLLGPFETGRG